MENASLVDIMIVNKIEEHFFIFIFYFTVGTMIFLDEIGKAGRFGAKRVVLGFCKRVFLMCLSWGILLSKTQDPPAF